MYSWVGMKKITKKEALERFNQNELVYLLYEDNTESQVIKRREIVSHRGDFGIEL